MNRTLGFVIAGCAKSGTTALAEALDRHPGIYMSDVKETNFFIHGFETVTARQTANGSRAISFGNPTTHIETIEAFESQFARASDEALLGEASPLYLLSENVPDRLLEHNQKMRVVLLLRNPTDVVFANFVHHVRDRAESVTIDDIESLLDENRYKDKNLHAFSNHLAIPCYSSQLPRWIKTFGPDRLHIEIFEEYKADPEVVIARIIEFIGIDGKIERTVNSAVNQSRLPRFAWLNKIVLDDSPLKFLVRHIIPKKQRRRLRLIVERLNAGARPELPLHARKILDERYRVERDYVEKLLGRPIQPWRDLLASSNPARFGSESEVNTNTTAERSVS